jgi:hypothetical protein
MNAVLIAEINRDFRQAEVIKSSLLERGVTGCPPDGLYPLQIEGKSCIGTAKDGVLTLEWIESKPSDWKE